MHITAFKIESEHIPWTLNVKNKDADKSLKEGTRE